MAKTEEKAAGSLGRQPSGTQKYTTRKGKIIILFLNYDYVTSAYSLNHFHNPSDSDITGEQHPTSMAEEALSNTLMEKELRSPKDLLE